MIDVAIIRMSGMRKCTGNLGIGFLYMSAVTGIQSNYSHCKLDIKLTCLANSIMMKAGKIATRADETPFNLAQKQIPPPPFLPPPTAG